MNAWLAGGLSSVLAIGAACAAADSGVPAGKDAERTSLESHGWITGGALNTVSPNNLPEKFRQAYFGERPKAFLLDPQGLLEPAQQHDRLAFLKDHAGDSSIDLFVYLFKGDQDIPADVRAEERVGRFFMKGRPASVVFYFMGAPRRSVVYLSPPILDRVPAVEQQRSLESSIMKALEKQDASEQLEAFLVQMSIRVYWMEQMMGGTAADGRPMVLTGRPARTKAKKPGLLTRLQPVIDRAKPWVMPAAALAGALVVLLGVVAVVRRRALHRFPEFEVEPRLGGSHAAGVGAVISFARGAPSPATQRDQTPDYLRRA